MHVGEVCCFFLFHLFMQTTKLETTRLLDVMKAARSHRQLQKLSASILHVTVRNNEPDPEHTWQAKQINLNE